MSVIDLESICLVLIPNARKRSLCETSSQVQARSATKQAVTDFRFNDTHSIANMPVPDYGAAPLAKTFMLARGLSLLAMVCIVGLTANFISEIVSTNIDPPREVVGTLTIVSTAPIHRGSAQTDNSRRPASRHSIP